MPVSALEPVPELAASALVPAQGRALALELEQVPASALERELAPVPGLALAASERELALEWVPGLAREQEPARALAPVRSAAARSRRFQNRPVR